ncbi:MAG: PmeII family type II restriction endonuclease [Candidatus Acidiferrales bacterium]
MPTIEREALEALIRRCLASFHKRRIEALDALNLLEILKRKNPYLFRATGIQSAPEMVERLLSAHISSSDETIFGGVFFEPICMALCGGRVAGTRGADFVIETDTAYEVIALKSGPNIFNSDQTSKQNQRFDEILRSLRATLRPFAKQFVPIMGCGYGRSNRPNPTEVRRYFKLAGQAFWQKVTNSADFHLELIRLMKDDPDRHSVEFQAAWDRALKRFAKQFSDTFCDSDGNILWEKLVQFNSGKNTKPSP